jgi:hypothetical protein
MRGSFKKRRRRRKTNPLFRWKWSPEANAILSVYKYQVKRRR